MRRLFKVLAASALVGAGSTGFAAVAYLQVNPRAFTTQGVSAEKPAEVEASVDRSAHGAFLPMTDAVRQVADRRTTPVARQLMQTDEPTKPEAEPAPRRLVPCTDWLDMGPASMTGENGPERRRVRMLCPEGAPVADYYDGDR